MIGYAGVARPDVGQNSLPICCSRCVGLRVRFRQRDNWCDDTALPKPDKKIGILIDRGAVVLGTPCDHGDHGATHDGH
jgi:hypothetical protein